MRNLNPPPSRHLYNPNKENFTVQYTDEHTGTQNYTIHAGEIEEFPHNVANHIVKHLAQHLVLSRGVRTTYDAEYAEAVKEIECDIT